MTGIRACLFDMDGLLLNTEDIYTEVTNVALAKHGKGPLPWSVKINLQGRVGHDAAQHLLDWAQIDYTPEEWFKLTSELQKTRWEHAGFLPGARELIEHLYKEKFPMALATSSATTNYELKTKHLRSVFDLFGKHVVTGDDPRVPHGRGKPAPDIWLVALKSINDDRVAAGLDKIAPSECLVFEDGVPGVTAAKAAGMHVVWVPHPGAVGVIPKEEQQKIIEGHLQLESLKDLDYKNWSKIQ